MYTTLAVIVGLVLDFLLGDPHGWPHPVIAIGKLISVLEKALRNVFPKTKGGEFLAGMLLWMLVCSVTCGVCIGILVLFARIFPWAYTFAASVMCYQIMATKSLKDESMKVYESLRKQNLEQARVDVSMIVGRDTEHLDESGVAKAAVETVAENTSDGSVAPLFYMVLLGPVGGFFYKAVNTMDSMLGYRNERYLYFGKWAAKADDVFNYIPARLSAWLMIAVSGILGYDRKHAAVIHRRDAKKSPSPNSAQTESVCAGAFGIQLLGDTSYFGVIHKKPTIGDKVRNISIEDIKGANRLLYGTVILAAVLLLAVRVCAVVLWCPWM